MGLQGLQKRVTPSMSMETPDQVGVLITEKVGGLPDAGVSHQGAGAARRLDMTPRV